MTPPAHGTLNFSESPNLRYINSGDGATSDTFVVYDSATPITFNVVILQPTPIPTVGHVYASVTYNSNNNSIQPILGGGAATSVTVGIQPLHGVATASGISMVYTPTPGYFGSDSFTYVASNSAGTSSPGTVSITVAAPPPLVLLPPALDGGTVGMSYAQVFSVSNGTPPYAYSESGTLPRGVTFDAEHATLLGTPTQAGDFPITVTATDAQSSTVTKPYTLHINQASQTITATNPGSVNFGAQPQPQLQASSSSTLPVQFSSTTTGVCTVTSTGLLSTIAPGTCVIHLDQAGDSEYLPAPEAILSFAIVVPGAAVSLPATSPPAGIGGVLYSTVFTAVGGVAPFSFTQSGTLPPGLTFSPSGALAGTPTAAGTFTFTLTVTDGIGQTAQQAYALTIQAPAMALAPGTLPSGKVGAAYASTTLTASGGTAPYSYAVTTGTLPLGLMLSTAGVISGTPTQTTSASVTITATDHLGFQIAHPYTIAVNQDAPTVADSSLATPANAPVTLHVTSTSGPVSGATVTTQPTHGTVTINGLDLVYTPANNYYGADSFKYTANGVGGVSNAATVSVTVSPLAVPSAIAQTATVLAGKSVTLHAATGATNGPFTAVAVTSPPGSGQAVVQGTDIVYTADANASGTVGFDFTVSNAFGASQPAHATITVNARPVAAALTATAVAGTSVSVDLTSGAHGGPFTAANVVSVSPANAGTATVSQSGAGYTLNFAAAPTFGGVASISYTLTNAFATSDPGNVSVSVTLRSDPSKDAEVLGVLDAQADSARRMATGQISNFQRRLESLHQGGSGGVFSNGLSFSSASSQRTRTLMPSDEQRFGGPSANDDPWNGYGASAASAAPSSKGSSNSLPGGISIWTGGAVNFGKSQPGSSSNGTDFTTSGLSLGADKQVNDKLTVGAGVGYGHDSSDIGQKTSHSAVDSYNVAVYGSYHPADSFYTDALVGYQWLSMDDRRYVTDNGNTVHGSRDGKQWFASLSVGYDHHSDNMVLTPYGRLDVARAKLDGYTETGDAVYSLKYQDQDVNTSTATVGVLAQWTAKRDYGIWAPQLRAEFGHDMQGSSQATMRYADVLTGPSYQATLLNQSRNHTLLGVGVALQGFHGWMIRAEYQNLLDNTSRDNQSILLGVEKKFGP